MSKAQPRRGFYDQKEDLPDYKPNYDYVKKKRDLGTLKFDLVTGRKTQAYKQATANEDVYDYDYYTKTTESKIFKR